MDIKHSDPKLSVEKAWLTMIITHSYIKNQWKIRIDNTWFGFILN
jgi:hypothetical protein